MNKIFLHILPDEKVVNEFVSNMESVYPNESEYVVYNTSINLKYVKESSKILHFNKNDVSFKEFLSDTSSYDIVCLHSLDADSCFNVLDHKNIIWIIWGAELYEQLLRPKGYELYTNPDELNLIRRNKLPLFLYKIHDYCKSKRDQKILLKQLKKIRWVVGLEGDYRLLKSFYPDIKCNYISYFCYYPVEKMLLPQSLSKYCTGKNVWINNSASLNGNHVGLFEKISSFNSDFKVICPLSYGLPKVASYIENNGSLMLGSKFMALKDFMPVAEYYDLFLQSNSFVFGHLRQCAFGNALMALYFGGKCFFYKANPMYSFFVEAGYKVYSIEDELTESNILSPLDDEYRALNRRIVNNMFSYEATKLIIKQVFDKCQQVIEK